MATLTGTLEDKKKQWYADKGETGTVADMELAHFRTLNSDTTLSRNDSIYKWLGDQGYSGTLTDRWKDFLEANTSLGADATVQDLENDWFSDTTNTYSSTVSSWDVLVASSGGDQTTITAGIAVSGANSIWVKQGTYSETANFNVTNQHAYIEPNTTISTLTISADDVSVILGTNCTITNALTISGDNVNVTMRNGCSMTGIVVSGANSMISGGGWGSESDGGSTTLALNLSNTDFSISSLLLDTTTGTGSNTFTGSAAADRAYMSCVQFRDSSEDLTNHSGDDSMFIGNTALGADDKGFQSFGPRGIYLGNLSTGVPDTGMHSTTGSSDTIIGANVIQQTSGTPIDVISAVDDNVVVGNRADGSITISDGATTSGANDETTF